jgi:hypothetical protein
MAIFTQLHRRTILTTRQFLELRIGPRPPPPHSLPLAGVQPFGYARVVVMRHLGANAGNDPDVNIHGSCAI